MATSCFMVSQSKWLIGTLLVLVLVDTLLANPCVDSSYKQGEPVPIGIAYWPGGLEGNWSGLHPCRQGDRERLNAEGVQIAFFKPSVDKLSFLRSTKEEEDGLMDVIGAGKPQVLTLVAFLGYSNFVRSEARTIRSTDASFTGGTGRASSLTLILRLENGSPKYLIWDEEDCYACGGVDSSKCIASRSCAIQEDNCISGDTNQVVDLSVGCNFTIPIAFSGTDQNSAVLTSSLELKRLSKYAVSRLTNNAINVAGARGSSVADWGQDTVGGLF